MDAHATTTAEALLRYHTMNQNAGFVQTIVKTQNAAGTANVEQRPVFSRSASAPLVSKPSPHTALVTNTASSRPPLQRRRSNHSLPPTSAHRQQRSQTLKGASNLPKQTHLLRKKMDRMLQCFHETVAEHDNIQHTRLQQLHMENEKLRKANQDLEIENLKYFKEVEDCEEQMETLEQQRQTLTEKMTTLREEKKELEGQFADLKAEIDELKNSNATLQTENESMRNELNEYTDWSHQKDRRVQELEQEMEKMKANVENKENTIFSSLKSLQQQR